MGCHFLLQGIFPTQELNLWLFHLLPWQVDSLPLAQSYYSITQSRLTLCDPMDCSTSMSGFPVLHHLVELAQTHVHRIGDAIQPSHPLLSPSPAFNSSSIRVFSNESALHIRWPKTWTFSFVISPPSEYSGLISFRIDWFDLLAV